MIDYRSDTVTRPCSGMLKAMLAAEVGDDVFGEDPTVNKLEEILAEMFGMEAALFCPSGTMTNQIAIKCHTQPGDEVICDESSHIYQYEGGGIAFHSGASVKLLQGNLGRIQAEQVEAAIQPDDPHRPRTRLVSLENTSNRGGGSCYDWNEIVKIHQVCKKHHLKLHLDGARLWNALIAKKETPEQYGKIFDSISVCLSKGLGCPAGSVLIGSKDFIRYARRIRKVFGGGMRQAGYLAAAGIYALQNNFHRLAEDHHHAKQIAESLKEKIIVKEILPVETNIIIFELKETLPAPAFADLLKKHQILVYAITPQRIRMVVHKDISPEMIQYTINIIQKI
ncbi:MAG: aminotransferase class I/II-fold pyridoxal phosphate-dependent enzyme [Chitinophagaceae bacterium]|nr:aminotransferase class I/II-fold pyridoxal phosphate-dependent enzyme [Chitinophagaceae bacterium]